MGTSRCKKVSGKNEKYRKGGTLRDIPSIRFLIAIAFSCVYEAELSSACSQDQYVLVSGRCIATQQGRSLSEL